MADPLLRHAIRIAVVFGVAMAIAQSLGIDHGYWLPMTVAWVSRPALGETTVKVTARVAGTLVGVRHLRHGLRMLRLQRGHELLHGGGHVLRGKDFLQRVG